MNYCREKYNIKSKVTAVFMTLVLTWFTISLPFVFESQQRASSHAASSDNQHDSEDCIPFGNSTEEKEASGSSSVSEEYLHHNNELFHNSELFLSHNPHHSVSEYISFHGEMLCPPPDIFPS